MTIRVNDVSVKLIYQNLLSNISVNISKITITELKNGGFHLLFQDAINFTIKPTDLEVHCWRVESNYNLKPVNLLLNDELSEKDNFRLSTWNAKVLRTEKEMNDAQGQKVTLVTIAVFLAFSTLLTMLPSVNKDRDFTAIIFPGSLTLICVYMAWHKQNIQNLLQKHLTEKTHVLYSRLVAMAAFAATQDPNTKIVQFKDTDTFYAFVNKA